MNRENLLRVADAIEKYEIRGLGYNQKSYLATNDRGYPDRSGHGCKTNACISGYTTAIILGRVPTEYEAASYVAKTAQFLGLDAGEQILLFSACPLDHNPSATEAVRTLRYAAEHGVIDWEAANRA